MLQYLWSVLLHLAALGLIMLAAWFPGNVVLVKRLKFHSLVERTVFTLGLGLGLSALFLFCLGLAGLLYSAFVVVITVGCAIGSLVMLLKSRKGVRVPEIKDVTRKTPAARALAALIVAAAISYWALLLHLTQYPPMNWDSTAYHLVLAREYLTQHRVVAHEGIAVPVLPALNHMLFSWALAVKDDILAQMVEHSLMFLTALGLYAWGSRRGSRGLGLAAAAFWVGQPLVIWLGESAYVDVGLVCYAFLGVYALKVFWDSREPGWWYLALLLLSFASGVKLPGLFLIGLATAAGLVSVLRAGLSWRTFAVGLGLAVLVTMPFYGFIAYNTANPFWPAVQQLSRGRWLDGSLYFSGAWYGVGVAKTPLNFLLLPVYLTLNPAPFLPDNNRTLLVLLMGFPIAWIVAVFDRSVRWWSLWAMSYMALWFVTSQQIRFMLPALPMMGLAIYESLRWIITRVSKATLVQAPVWAGVALFAIWVGGWTAHDTMAVKGYLPPVTNEQRDDMLSRADPGYEAVLYVNSRAREGEGVYVMNAPWLDYYFKPRVIDSLALLQRNNRPTFRWPEDKEWTRGLESNNVMWVFINYDGLYESLLIPARDPRVTSFWPSYQLVYSNRTSWVFRHVSVSGSEEKVMSPGR